MDWYIVAVVRVLISTRTTTTVNRWWRNSCIGVDFKAFDEHIAGVLYWVNDDVALATCAVVGDAMKWAMIL